MKKLLVLALLIASVTFIFAVESDFSDVVGYVKYELTAGSYTMIALPMDSGITNTIELADAIGNVSYVINWNNGWRQYSETNEATAFDVEIGQSYLVYLDNDTNVDFYCAGTLPVQASYDIVAGNFTQIMLPLNRSDILTADQLKTEIGEDVQYIITWDSGAWRQYSSSNPATSFDINIGQGFLIFSNEAVTGWNAPAGRNITTKRASARK